MPNYNTDITKYIDGSADFAKPILTKLREIIHKACPDVEEKLSWSRPHYYYKGKGMLVTDALKERVTFGVWFDSLVYESPELSTEAKAAKEGLGFMKTIEDIPSEKILIETIKLAMKVIDEGRVVSRPKTAKKPVVIPEYFTAALSRDKGAEAGFEKLSPSHKREYIEWIVEAKTEPTREKRIAQTLAQVKTGKSKHWKYQR